MEAVALGLSAVVCLVVWVRYLNARDVRRHAQRVELVEKRAAAWKAEAVEELKQRVGRLELKAGYSR